jgi:DNA-binding FadR family transcriptional regulator
MDVMEVRLVLEPEAARLAAVRATAGDLEHLEKCVRKAEEAPDFGSYARWDAAFHRAIAEAASNKVLFVLFDSVNTVRTQKAWQRLWQGAMNQKRQAKYDDHHKRIMQAISDHNASEAFNCMREHLEAVRSNLIGDKPNGADL